MKAFAMCLKIKSNHRNGTIYNYKPSLLEPSCSRYLASKLVEKAIKLGMIRMHNNNLTVVGLNKLLETHKLGWKSNKKIEINKEDSVNDIYLKLNYILLKDNHNQYLYRNSDQASESNKGEMDVYHIGCRRLGEILNTTHSTASKILKKLDDKGMIDTKRYIKEIHTKNQIVSKHLQYLNFGRGHVYSMNNVIYIDKGSIIYFNL